LKLGPETLQKCSESLDKVSISLISEIFEISAKISGISETYGISGIFFGVSACPPDSFGNLRENTITFHSGLQIRRSWTLWKGYSEDYPFKLKNNIQYHLVQVM